MPIPSNTVLGPWEVHPTYNNRWVRRSVQTGSMLIGLAPIHDFYDPYNPDHGRNTQTAPNYHCGIEWKPLEGLGYVSLDEAKILTDRKLLNEGYILQELEGYSPQTPERVDPLKPSHRSRFEREEVL